MSGRDDHDRTQTRLGNITTMWTLLNAAHQGSDTEAQLAKDALLKRYGGAVYRYVLAAVRNTDLADDLTQEFALRLIRGGFRHADPDRGRFRDYLKTSLFHLVREFRRKQNSQRIVDDLQHFEPSEEPPELMESDAQFLQGWREELIARTWQTLGETNRGLFDALKVRADFPKDSSEQLADRLSSISGTTIQAPAFRQKLKRARDAFAEILRNEVAFSLENPSSEQVQQELQLLDLWQYVK